MTSLSVSCFANGNEKRDFALFDHVEQPGAQHHDGILRDAPKSSSEGLPRVGLSHGGTATTVCFSPCVKNSLLGRTKRRNSTSKHEGRHVCGSSWRKEADIPNPAEPKCAVAEAEHGSGNLQRMALLKKAALPVMEGL